MNRKIFWRHGKRNISVMENAYKRAEEIGGTDILEVMEDEALKEAEKHCVIIPGAKLYVNRKTEKLAVTPENFHLLKEDEIEGVICFIGKIALARREDDSQDVVKIHTSPAVLKCPSCSAFQLMEEMENAKEENAAVSYKIYMSEKNDLFGVYMSFLKTAYPKVGIELILE